jgi:hypothetical protein
LRRLTALAPFALLACVEQTPAGDRVCSREDRRLFPIYQRTAVDLLFIVDRTPSMSDEQATLLANAPVFANVLQQLEGGLPDLHVAVVTTDVGGQGVTGCTAGDGARFQGGARCGLSGTFLDAHQGDTGVAEAFTCLLDLPLSTCPVSQPIAAMIRALDGSDPANDGFRREDAYLAVVIITDGDDCSLVEAAALSGLADEQSVDVRCAALGEPPLASVADSIDWIRPDDPKFLIGTLIAGSPPRLSQLEPALPERYNHVDVNGPNWGDALIQLAWWDPGVGNQCFETDIDMEPTIPGIQPECVGSFHTRDDSTRLPWCNEPGAGQPCMRVVDDPLWCPDAVKLNVETGDQRFPGGAWADIRCALPCGD